MSGNSFSRPVGCALARNVACKHATSKIPGSQLSAFNFQLLS
ncbi:MAG: hypothetical protein JWQ62_3012 [Lacunisphaera sp.]|nr:hypothetical protein [Lacunisphaera sp.]